MADRRPTSPAVDRDALARRMMEVLQGHVPSDAMMKLPYALADAILALVRPVEGVTLTPETVLDAIRRCAPYGMELDPLTGAEDRLAAAYVEGVHAAYEAVEALAARLEAAS